MKNIKIALVGGPCGGKTSSINIFVDKLSDKYNVSIVEETANALLNLGYLDEYPMDILDFQDLLFKIQFINEYYSELDSDLLLCDRGLFDALEYIDESEFYKILDRNNLNKEIIRSTYNRALYFRTIAYEYPKSFSLQRQYETSESAIQRDIKSLNVWKDKLLNIRYDNTKGLNIKQNIIFNELEGYLKNLKGEGLFMLSDYYSEKYTNNMKDSIKEICDKNRIPNRVRKKTMELIKW